MNVGEEFSDVVEQFKGFAYGVVIPIIFAVLAVIFLIIGIIRGAHIASADNEDTKKKAVKSMVWFLIGFALCFIVAFATPTLFKYLSAQFPVTQV